MATVADLRLQAKNLGLKGYSKATKAELETMIAAASAPAPSEPAKTIPFASAPSDDGKAIEAIASELAGKSLEATAEAFRRLTPGIRRRVRKSLASMGKTGHAAIDIRQSTIPLRHNAA